jgi:hypothetical protein
MLGEKDYIYISTYSLGATMNTIRIQILILILFIVTGCVSLPKDIEEGKEIASNEGVLVTQLDSNRISNKPWLSNVEIFYRKNGSRINSGKMIITRSKELKAIALPAGKYEWNQVSFAGGYSPLQGGFTIKQNEVTYIGDILVNLNLDGNFIKHWRVKITVSDSTSSIKNEMMKKHPKIFKNRKFNKEISQIQ